MTEKNDEFQELKKLHFDLEQFAKETLDAVTAHICVLDKNGNIIAVNQAWKDFYDKNFIQTQHYISFSF